MLPLAVSRQHPNEDQRPVLRGGSEPDGVQPLSIKHCPLTRLDEDRVPGHEDALSLGLFDHALRNAVLSENTRQSGFVSQTEEAVPWLTLTEPPALKPSTLARRLHSSPSSRAIRSRRTSGVPPIRLSAESWIAGRAGSSGVAVLIVVGIRVERIYGEYLG